MIKGNSIQALAQKINQSKVELDELTKKVSQLSSENDTLKQRLANSNPDELNQLKEENKRLQVQLDEMVEKLKGLEELKAEIGKDEGGKKSGKKKKKSSKKGKKKKKDS